MYISKIMFSYFLKRFNVHSSMFPSMFAPIRYLKSEAFFGSRPSSIVTNLEQISAQEYSMNRQNSESATPLPLKTFMS